MPQRVGSDEGLTSSRPTPPSVSESDADDGVEPPTSSAQTAELEDAEATAPSDRGRSAPVEQTRDDTDEGWGERGEDDASARWLRENRPPHWS